MRFEPTHLAGVFFVRLAPHQDERGLFARTFCATEFIAVGIDFKPAQCNISRNPASGTLRGMHFQLPPHGEAKLIQSVRGRVFDVAIDLRQGSATLGQWLGTELSANGDTMLYIPEGFAHGFVTLEPDSDVLYYMGSPFVSGIGGGVRWNDPAFGIDWPIEPTMISERDATYPDFDRTLALPCEG